MSHGLNPELPRFKGVTTHLSLSDTLEIEYTNHQLWIVEKTPSFKTYRRWDSIKEEEERLKKENSRLVAEIAQLKAEPSSVEKALADFISKLQAAK